MSVLDDKQITVINQKLAENGKAEYHLNSRDAGVVADALSEISHAIDCDEEIYTTGIKSTADETGLIISLVTKSQMPSSAN